MGVEFLLFAIKLTMIFTHIHILSYIEKFEIHAKPLNDKVIENCIQIKLLEVMRDTLLPKLMSGEVRVEG
ncbi:restriction endonuclease subunit S domain-containing protein [Methanosarcina mazei]|nr:hypothetical protein [Methanosarcina mazei]